MNPLITRRARSVTLANLLSKEDSKDEIACDTAEGADDLVAYYTRFGYRLIEHHQWDKACYRSVILSKSLSE
mgnify:CR=1 FL=1